MPTLSSFLPSDTSPAAGELGLQAVLAKVVPVVILLVGIGVTFQLVRWQNIQNQILADTAFLRVSDQLAESLRQRIEHYEHGIRAASRLFVVGPDLSRQQFGAAFRAVDLDREFPGAQGIGFVRRVAKSDEAAFLQKRRSELGGDYGIRRQGVKSESIGVRLE
jgi:CHASE1-domain containing sensor protein